MEIGNEIIVYCAKGYGEEVYIKLLSKGYRVAAFCDNAKINEGGMRLGLPVYNYQECRRKYPDAVYVVANSTYAAAIAIGADLERDGYRKGSSYFLSLELEEQGELSEYKKQVPKVLEHKTLILFGRPFLCDLFRKWIENLEQKIDVQTCPSEESIDEFAGKWEDAIWVPLEMGVSLGLPERDEDLVRILQAHGICSFTRFFLGHMLYCEELPVSGNTDRIMDEFGIQVEKVLFLKSSPFSGSLLIDNILDFHPNILFLGLNPWGCNIWHIVKASVDRPGEELAEAIAGEIKYYLQTAGAKDLSWLERYQEVMGRYFRQGVSYSEREIFLLIYLAYYEFQHNKPLQGEAIIYMDIHSNKLMRDSIFKWLERMKFDIILLAMIRTPYKRMGSYMKMILYSFNQPHETLFPYDIYNLLYMMAQEKLDEEEKKYPLVRIRFEDLKMHPQKVLEKLCGIVGFPWSDTLLETTENGKERDYVVKDSHITGFDLKPVYYSYEQFFDAFDKFRLDLISREKSKAYGYSYVGRDKYPMSCEELGRLFEYPFYFERFMAFKDEADRERYHKRMGMLCTQLLYMQEEKKKYGAYFQYGEYLNIGESKIFS